MAPGKVEVEPLAEEHKLVVVAGLGLLKGLEAMERVEVAHKRRVKMPDTVPNSNQQFGEQATVVPKLGAEVELVLDRMDLHKVTMGLVEVGQQQPGCTVLQTNSQVRLENIRVTTKTSNITHL